VVSKKKVKKIIGEGINIPAYRSRTYNAIIGSIEPKEDTDRELISRRVVKELDSKVKA